MLIIAFERSFTYLLFDKGEFAGEALSFIVQDSVLLVQF